VYNGTKKWKLKMGAVKSKWGLSVLSMEKELIGGLLGRGGPTGDENCDGGDLQKALWGDPIKAIRRGV